MVPIQLGLAVLGKMEAEFADGSLCKIEAELTPESTSPLKSYSAARKTKDLLLVNAVIGEKSPIVDLVLKNPYNLADIIGPLDIKAYEQEGRWFNVEMQISEDLNFDKRAIYY